MVSEGNELAGMRRNYAGGHELDEAWLADGWAPLLRRWIDDAVAEGVVEPNAMVLATVDDAGMPATRMVLCKGISPEGVVFYTNYGSDKARHLDAAPRASATFGWPLAGRQVTVRGGVEKVDPTEYWRARPRGSQLGAWASQQSRPVASRAELLAALAAVTARFAGADVPVPPNWGGYRIRPVTVEFWQGRENRLHNRIRLDVASGAIVRLQP